MLPRTCIILLLLSLLTAAASVVDWTTSVGAVKRPQSVRAVGSVAGRKRPAAGRRPPGRAQGQGQATQGQPQATQGRRPARRPQRRPTNPRQTPAYIVCDLYPAGSPTYRDIRPNRPFAAATSGPPPYVTYRSSQPAKAGNRAPNAKSYWPQAGYPVPPYPLKLVCPIYQPLTANAVVSQLQVSGSADNNPDNVLVPDYPDITVVDVDPGVYNIPDDGDFPLPYDNVYDPSGLDPAGGYVTPEAFAYPPPFSFR